MPGRTNGPTGALPHALVLAVLAGVAAVVGLIIAYEALFVLQVAAVGALLALVLRTVARGLEAIGLSPFVSAIVLLAGFGADSRRVAGGPGGGHGRHRARLAYRTIQRAIEHLC